MRVVGLLGGVASGKSTVARQLCEMGAESLDADRVGHEVLRLPEVERAARARWGDAVFGDDGHLSRRAVAGIVFERTSAGRQELRFLEELTHPEIGLRLARNLEEMRKRLVMVAVLDAPVMLKAGWDQLCDVIVFVDVPREERLARAKARGWSEDEFAAREGAQESLNVKRQRADVVIDNSGSPDHTRNQVRSLWHSLVS